VGDAVFVTTRSAWVDVATTSFAVALLFARFGSFVVVVTVAVLLMAVPAAVPVGTFNTIEKLDEVTPRLASVQLMVPVPPAAGVVQDHPDGTVIEPNVVFAGVVSVRVVPAALLGPEFVTTCV
jgi:hypothetical protein